MWCDVFHLLTQRHAAQKFVTAQKWRPMVWNEVFSKPSLSSAPNAALNNTIVQVRAFHSCHLHLQPLQYCLPSTASVLLVLYVLLLVDHGVRATFPFVASELGEVHIW